MSNPILEPFEISGRYLNTVNDPTPGKSVDFLSLGTGFLGLVGKVLPLSIAEALRLSDTSIGTLYAGEYQFVQFKSDSTQSNAVGQLLWWSTVGSIVTPDPPTELGSVAGICINAVTKGNYGFMLRRGVVNTLYGTITKSGGAVAGDAVIAASATVGKANVLADATAVTWATNALMIGRAYEAATSDQTKRIFFFGQAPAWK